MENKELKSRLAQNSKNSNRPPSSDGLKKRPAFPRKKDKKTGGQKGHKGRTLEMVAHPGSVVKHAPVKCQCGQSLKRVLKHTVERRQIFDLPEPKLEITEHQLLGCSCPNCRRLNVGEFPAEVPSRVQYGNGVRALSVLLNTGLNMPLGKVRQFFADIFGYDLNDSTQLSAHRKCYGLTAASEGQLRHRLLGSRVNHFDETGLRVAGKLHWLHNCSNSKCTYLSVHPNRGRKALDSPSSLLPFYTGWSVHDCWPPYFKYENPKHAICNAHLLRELQALIEQGSKWAGLMHGLLLYAYEKSNKGSTAAADPSFIERQYDRICKWAGAEEPKARQRFRHKRAKKTKGRNLLDRLVKHKPAVLAFINYDLVPFTNNQAERDVRPAKIKLKNAGSFRTLIGAHIYARIQSFISTARKHQLNVFNELVAIFNGYSFLTTPDRC